ncbi:MAG: YifB family Mg chelatase-like AAA ATPase [Candidatus Omnitrophica bacterium]|nr:YifB family Mg chelatase-like AAA ATPase [Candidatus Omnitrophota bacterium]MBU2265494.1 YifB family Mg chelatase-like AAA ATPase [Candidatus Omnitrophota bacterium]MBU2473804.1 YifB family Mg chelatase-like AAA ATPase [Candidatus Omnitrophota bacterium]
MLVKVPSALNLGLETLAMEVEVNVASRGLPAFEIVGLPTKTVAESKERVKTAIVNSNIEFPSRRIVVNLAPADVPKQGSFYDLPIAVGILTAVTGCPLPKKSLFFGELSLDGTLRHTRGALLLALFAKERGIKNIFIPKLSANEAAIIKGVNIYPIDSLNQLLLFLCGQIDIKPATHCLGQQPCISAEFDMSEILGQERAKRAIEIAAAGGHNLFMVGSPGSGKTMLARAFSGILPLLNDKETLEVTKIYSASGLIPPLGSVIRTRPFRSPHHTISDAGLIGGGSHIRPGEISLAHRGVLFLDEFNEFSRMALETLRQPLEDGRITICRSREKSTFPCQFILLASANPCPCGYLYHPKKVCICRPREIERYRKKISGPILDRIDLCLEVPVVNVKELSGDETVRKTLEPSELIAQRVIRAREVQAKRFIKEGIYTNAEMRNRQIKKYCRLCDVVTEILIKAGMNFNLSARSFFKMIRVARTIADLEDSQEIEVSHMAEALQYRLRENKNG